jgi:hypothetical protein
MIAAVVRTARSPPRQYRRPANALQIFRKSFVSFATLAVIRRARPWKAIARPTVAPVRSRNRRKHGNFLGSLWICENKSDPRGVLLRQQNQSKVPYGPRRRHIFFARDWLNIVMLKNLSDEIRVCLRHAEACARQAKEASESNSRENYLDMQCRWLELAHKHFIAMLEALRKPASDRQEKPRLHVRR